MCQMVLNNDKNGVELYFESKPATNIISDLKELGFRWHTAKKCWFAKQNQRTMNKANELAENNETATVVSEEKVTEDYCLPCNLNIYDNGKIDILNNHNSLYFKAEKMYAHIYANSIVVIDLTNAMKTGKTCTYYSLRDNINDGLVVTIYNKGIKTFSDLFAAIKNGELTEYISTAEQKSSSTFSPFVKVNPIKTPTKWNRTHIWKAILSGQIWNGETSYHYTDDYAYDYAYNYHQGCGVDLIKLAIEIIEDDCKGYSIYTGKTDENGNIEIHFSTYSFDSKTLIFNESFNHEKGAKARQEKVDELNKYNDDMKSKIIKLNPDEFADNQIYSCQWIEQDGNTGKYGIKSELMFGRSLFWFDEEDKEQSKDFISVERYNIINDKFYTITDFFNRATDESVYDDKRIIQTGNWEHICTGLSLAEMLLENKKFDTIQENNISFELLRNQLTAHAEGNAFWIGCTDEINYTQELYKLNIEEMKVKEIQNNVKEDVVCVI